MRSSFLGSFDERVGLRRSFRSGAEVGAVASTFVLASGYWPVTEHVVYLALMCLLAMRVASFSWEPPNAITSLALFSFLLFLSYLLLSSIWSTSTGLALAYGLEATLVAFIGILIGAAVPLRSILRGLVAGVILVTVHAYVMSPASFPFDEWGLFTNPSTLTFLVGVGFIALLGAARRSVPSLAAVVIIGFWFISILFGIQNVIFTSLFSLLGAALVLAVSFSLRFFSRAARARLVLGFISIAAALFVTAWVFREQLLRPLGLGTDFSGRIDLWSEYFDALFWRPILGSGWGSSVGWPPLAEDRLYPVRDFFPAHQGFLDAGLMLGVIGIGLLLATITLIAIAGAQMVIETPAQWSFSFTPALLVYMVLNDLMATSFVRLIGLFLVGVMVGILLARFHQGKALRLP